MKVKQNEQATANNHTTGISKAGIEARRNYYRQYYKKNKKQIQANQKAYWNRIGSSSAEREIAED